MKRMPLSDRPGAGWVKTVRRINALFLTQRQLGEKLAARRARLDVVRHDVDRYRKASPSGAVKADSAERIGSIPRPEG